MRDRFGMELPNDAAAQEDIRAIIRRHAHREGAMLPILHAIQADYGWISEATIRTVAHELNLSRAEVHGVVSFYHDFRTRPEERPVLKLCRAEACQARGSEPLAAWAETKAAGRIAIEPVYCLGLCSVGPNAMLGKDVHARLDQASLGALIEAL
jgi:formate dehydrogenase subunit gamma